MTDTKIKTLSREFRLYDGEDTGLAPLAVIPVPDTVGESDGAATEHLFKVTDTLGIDLLTVTAVLFKTVAPTPDHDWPEISKSLESLGVPYKEVGVATWTEEEEDSSPDEATPTYILKGIYTVGNVKTAHDSYEEHLATFKEEIDYKLDYCCHVLTGIYELDCGEL